MLAFTRSLLTKYGEVMHKKRILLIVSVILGRDSKLLQSGSTCVTHYYLFQVEKKIRLQCTVKVGMPGPVNFDIAPPVSTTTTHGSAGSEQFPFKTFPLTYSLVSGKTRNLGW